METQILGGRYKLIEKIGGGGMAIVYKAKCTLLNRYVAVKILRPEFTSDEEFVKRFQAEAQAAASLSHPNIVSIYDVGNENGIHYIVMEYIDGITLKEYINQNGTLPWREATNIAIQICSALEQAHRNHIVHRDIKPHNILITKDGIAKVTDFGIAKAVSSSTITMVGNTIGSVHYFSPEQARGGYVDEKSDLYSLGIVMYEMVTGRTPFNGDTPVAIALKHIQSQAVQPIAINPQIPRGINDIIVKAITKEQNGRYQSASEMLSDLNHVLREPEGGFIKYSGADDSPTVRINSLGEKRLAREKEEIRIKGNNSEKKNSGKDKIATWLAVATSVVIMLVFIVIGFKTFFPAIQEKDIVIEDYVGKRYEDVKAELARYNIIAEENLVFNDEYGEGIIVRQDVPAGTEFKVGGANKIVFDVSKGPHLIEIPDFRNEDYRKAETYIENELNLKTNVVDEYSDDVPNGHVIRTEPGPEDGGVSPDTVVTIVKSIGPKLEMVTVPNLLGKTYNQVQNELYNAKLKIGKVTPENVSSAVDKVIRQFPEAGATVEEGTAVDIEFDISINENNETNNGNENNNNEDSGNNGNDNNNNNNNEVGILSRKTVYQPIVLSDPDKYGDEINVYVEATPSDTNESKVLVNKTMKKSDFPLTVPVEVPESGYTNLHIKLDDVYTTDIVLD
ncbi:MAG TPA: Stk1 family PASTA domain-containing Ser/Thr kinase [Clostridiaceae bacterium]|nr:Stk1 family PASTA domain-containing Ser/Thr kinase [Clostridiaceae bacterium]